ncbi:hypothetical protein DRO26_02790 [Candidatus Bathyarchaeota archaeon]|nr:MAG: hypothetical protein DRO26_02790 [Candidatus Bathyarchaeota archaeon]
MKLRKAVIATAGLGTRLLSVTKELPKEMLPVFFMSKDGNLSVKPLLQMVFEQLYRNGFREFCFIVGRGKRSVEDHFTPDWKFVEELNNKGKESLALDLQEFYRMVESSTVVWVNQPEPKGFGHAILQAKPFVGDEPFMALAGDTYIISPRDDHLRRLMDGYIKSKAEATLLLEWVSNPKIYGVAVLEEETEGLFKVKGVVEKPEKPPSNWAIMPLYVFKSSIMDALSETGPGIGGEIQLTDAIQKLIMDGRKVTAVTLDKSEVRLDIGTPNMYWEALKTSHEYWRKTWKQ